MRLTINNKNLNLIGERVRINLPGWLYDGELGLVMDSFIMFGKEEVYIIKIEDDTVYVSHNALEIVK